MSAATGQLLIETNELIGNLEKTLEPRNDGSLGDVEDGFCF
jgi:hypothetical protein